MPNNYCDHCDRLLDEDDNCLECEAHAEKVFAAYRAAYDIEYKPTYDGEGDCSECGTPSESVKNTGLCPGCYMQSLA